MQQEGFKRNKVKLYRALPFSASARLKLLSEWNHFLSARWGKPLGTSEMWEWRGSVTSRSQSAPSDTPTSRRERETCGKIRFNATLAGIEKLRSRPADFATESLKKTQQKNVVFLACAGCCISCALISDFTARRFSPLCINQPGLVGDVSPRGRGRRSGQSQRARLSVWISRRKTLTMGWISGLSVCSSPFFLSFRQKL